jgi:hypothetical protein
MTDNFIEKQGVEEGVAGHFPATLDKRILGLTFRADSVAGLGFMIQIQSFEFFLC